jgi:cytochrome c
MAAFFYGTSYWSYGASFRMRSSTIYEKFLDLIGRGKYVEPIYFFTPSPALTSLIQVNNFSKEWDGDLLLGSLKAASMYRIRLSEVNRVQNIEQINLNSRIRDVTQIGNKIILLADGGSLLILSKSDSPLFTGPTYPALNGCLGCHVLNASSKNPFAPNLSNLYGSKLGSSNYDYSLSFIAHKNMTWSDENLRNFLLNPQKFIPGTKMPSMNYKPDYVDSVVKELKILKANQK